MKSKVKWLLVAIALLGISCSFSTLLSNTPEDSGLQPVATQERPSDDAGAKPAATQGRPPRAKVLFRDDFSDPDSGWDRASADDGSMTDYVDGHYRILVNDTQADIWANPGQYFTGDIVVEVDAVKNGGPDDNDFGVLCRYQDVDNYYAFFISSDGYVGIGRVLNGEQSMLTDDGKMFQSDAVAQGSGALNHITAKCIGDRLTLIVNGKKVLTVHDSTFTDGDVGLIAGTYDEPGTDILFDNLVVHRP